ncbi:hypothetical protein ACO22_07135 [Paracoccidioides brasiliensis]|uniref:Rhodopsin domain-containing protein n=1 Tax=Paracoccidioides brasiliensis TaxID=121759 RepID=A0A1D2J5N4_PARBR|nr:hypothetical protein ACO22_07135 [Paracoccidioides brasiliensis]
MNVALRWAGVKAPIGNLGKPRLFSKCQMLSTSSTSENLHDETTGQRSIVMGSAEWEINPHAYQPKSEEWIEQELKTGGEFFQNNSPGDRADITENRMDIGGPVRSCTSGNSELPGFCSTCKLVTILQCLSFSRLLELLANNMISITISQMLPTQELIRSSNHFRPNAPGAQTPAAFPFGIWGTLSLPGSIPSPYSTRSWADRRSIIPSGGLLWRAQVADLLVSIESIFWRLHLTAVFWPIDSLLQQSLAARLHGEVNEAEPGFRGVDAASPAEFHEVAISLLVASWLIVAFRCYVRAKLTRWGLDDIFVIAVLLIFTGCASCLMKAASMGLGKRIVKISFCLSLLRVVIGRGYIYTIYAVGTVTAIFTTFYFFFALFSCWPVEFVWEQIRNPNSGGTCRQYHKVVAGSYAHGSIVCVGDLILAIVPALMIRKLQLNSRTKLSAGLLLGFGSVASVATIARLTYVKYGYDQKDFLYTNTEIMIWSMVEIGVSIIAISAVTLKPLLMKYKIFFHSQDSNARSPHDRGRIYRNGGGDFTYTIGSGPPRKSHYSRQHRSSAHGKISASRLRPDNTVAKGRSSSEENIWISKGDGQTIPSRDGVDDDLELIPRGQIQKVVEFSTSRVAAELDKHSTPAPEHRYEQA